MGYFPLFCFFLPVMWLELSNHKVCCELSAVQTLLLRFCSDSRYCYINERRLLLPIQIVALLFIHFSVLLLLLAYEFLPLLTYYSVFFWE